MHSSPSLLGRVPTDQVYFLVAQLVAFLYAFLLRRQVVASLARRSSLSPHSLHLAIALPGLLLACLCFGLQTLHLVLLATLCFCLVRSVSGQWVHHWVMALAMAYLALLHLLRLRQEHGQYSLDITAPLMILVQKVTLVALDLHDGHTRPPTGGARQPLSEPPGVLQYSAYVFDFHTCICGPLIFYSDFSEYISGAKLRRIGLRQYPSAASSLLRKLLVCLAISAVMLSFGPLFPVARLQDAAFPSSPAWRKWLHIYLVALCARLKYYFAWTISECVANASGMGFNGLDPHTERPRWDLMTNIDIVRFENALSQRDSLLSWNKTTEKWLRRVAYDRAPPRLKLLLTFALSAVWHGFHPGYYLTFLSGAMFTLAARTARRCLRFRFEAMGPKPMLLYHAVTWTVTRLSMAYLAMPFVLLDLRPSLQLYSHLHWAGHLVALLLITLLPLLLRPRPKATCGQSTGHLCALPNGAHYE